MIGIIDYGMGNLKSVANALAFLEIPYVISSDVEELQRCEKLILPGVGSFKNCMENIHARGLFDPIQQMVNEGKPLLGICLGMQMLYESSDENGETEGFGFLKGHVTLMQTTLPVPQIGWNLLEKQNDSPVFACLSKEPYVYYVHSYYASQIDENELYGYSTYGEVKVPGLVGKGHVLGCQFHPEKSGTDGLAILSYYAKETI